MAFHKSFYIAVKPSKCRKRLKKKRFNWTKRWGDMRA